jgi:hypothetical protein
VALASSERRAISNYSATKRMLLTHNTKLPSMTGHCYAR